MAQSTTRSRAGRSVKPTAHEPLDLEAVVGEIRALWDAIERSNPVRRKELYEEVAKAVVSLRGRVESRLPADPTKPATYPLFQDFEPADRGASEATGHQTHLAGRFAEPILRLYDKDLAAEALACLPQASRFTDVEAFRGHLARTLRFNAESTRRRAANYLTGRYFPCGIIHEDLARFAAAAVGRPWLGEVLFYLTCRIEKIVGMVADEVVCPALADGGVTRTRITDYVGGRVPSWSKNSVRDVGAAIIRTYERLGVGSPDRTRLNVSLRRGDLASFAYVLHLEFPEPGMFGFEKLMQGPMRRWLLWDQDWIVKQLYACEEAGLLAKISEIDRAKQFTTKFTLDEAVGPIVSLIEERRP